MHMHLTQRKSLIRTGAIISPLQKRACQRPSENRIPDRKNTPITNKGYQGNVREERGFCGNLRVKDINYLK